jgi:hypothetical protein
MKARSTPPPPAAADRASWRTAPDKRAGTPRGAARRDERAGTPVPDAAGTPAHRSPRRPTCRWERPARIKNNCPCAAGIGILDRPASSEVHHGIRTGTSGRTWSAATRQGGRRGCAATCCQRTCGLVCAPGIESPSRDLRESRRGLTDGGAGGPSRTRFVRLRLAEVAPPKSCSGNPVGLSQRWAVGGARRVAGHVRGRESG